MKTSIKTIAATVFAVAGLSTIAQAGTINFSGYTWTTVDSSNPSYGPDSGSVANSYATPDANTGVINGIYGSGLNNAMVTSLTMGVGDTASYDLYLSNASMTWPHAWGGNYLGNWTSQFIDGTVIGNPDATFRTYSSGTDHNGNSLNDGTDHWFTYSADLSTGIHYEYAFALNTYTITATSIANPGEINTATMSYKNGDVTSIQGFVIGLWDSEQISTIANFTVTPAPEPGTTAFLCLGGFGFLLARRRRA